MSLIVTPPSVVEPFGINADPSYITLPIPVDSQIPVTAGAASFNDGFPPLTMTPKTSGGVPPSGKDFNGLLYTLSAHVAWLAAGGTYAFNQDVVDIMGGYPVGFIIRSAAMPSLFFYNSLADNTNDPDIDLTGWLPFNPLSTPTDQLIDAPAAGSYNNVAVGKNVGFFDVDTTLGDVVYTGLTAGSDGQIVVVTNTGANLLTLVANSGLSTAGNRFRQPADLSYTQLDGRAYRYSAQVGFWIPM